MKLRDVIKRAIEQEDPVAAEQAENLCRFWLGLTRDETQALVNAVVGRIVAETWTALLAKASEEG